MKNLEVSTKKKETSSNQIKQGAFMSYLDIAFKIISGLIYTPWMIKEIGQSDYGLYSLGISLIGFFAVDFGLGSAVSRFLSKYKATGDKNGERQFLGIAFKLFTIISTLILIILIIVYFLIENIYVELTPIEINKLKIIYVISGLYTVLSFPFKPFDGILISNERFIFIKFVDLMIKILTVVFMTISLLLGYGLYALVLLNAFLGLLKVFVKYKYIKKNITFQIDYSSREKTLYSSVFKFSLWTTIIVIAQRLIINITPTILGAFAGSVQIALFSVASVIEGYTYTITHALGGMFLPRVTKMIVNDKDGMLEVENLLIKVGRIQLIIVGLILSGFTSMGLEFMQLWMGENFIDSYYISLLLVSPGIVSLTQEIASTALVAKGEIRYRAVSSIIVASISVLLSMTLSPIYGAIGSAIAIFLGNILGSVILMSIIYSKILDINIWRFFTECHLKMLLPIVLTIIIGLLMQSCFPVNSLILFCLKVGLLILVYFVFMWIIALNKYEKQLFTSLFYKIIRRR